MTIAGDCHEWPGAVVFPMAFLTPACYDFNMNRLAEQLDEKLRTLDPVRARYLEAVVREALEKIEHPTRWPVGYFEQTAGSLAGEEFERPAQGNLPSRADW